MNASVTTEQRAVGKQKSEKKHYLGSDLISTLAGLQVHNFAHFETMDARVVGQYMGIWAAGIDRETGSCGRLLGICCTASKSVHWAQSVVQLDVIAMATKDRRREGRNRDPWKWRIGCEELHQSSIRFSLFSRTRCTPHGPVHVGRNE